MGFSKYVLPPWLYQKKKIFFSMRRQKKVADRWNPLLDDYFAGKIEKYHFEPKKKLTKNKKIIWQYWAQGMDVVSLPEIVKLCFASVDKCAGDEYEIIRVCDATIHEYLDVPQFVWDKKKLNSDFTITFFSDLLRVMLLHVYGGIWMDATILLTGNLPEEYTQMDYFLFQRFPDETHKDYWIRSDIHYFCWLPTCKVNMLSSVIFAKKDNEVIKSLLDIMLYIWKHSKKINYYYTFQVIYNEVITRKLAHRQCTVVSDCTPHLFQKRLQLGYSYLSFAQALSLTSIHKMTYFDTSQIASLREYLQQLPPVRQ